MNRQIRLLGAGMLVMYLALFIKLNQVQVFQAEELNDRPANTRALQRDFNQPRGTISSADGSLLAFSEERREALSFQRVYPERELFAHVTGYYSFNLGSDGVERTYNDDLAGRTPALELKLDNLWTDESTEGNVRLSLRRDIQVVARDSLDGAVGSVVALDPRTGGILAMYSNPTYDPNLISSNDTDAAEAAKGLYGLAPGEPLLAHTYRERYAPGSTFKVVTSAAGLTQGTVTETEPEYPSVRQYTPPLTTRPISNFGQSVCGGTLFTVLAKSCNTAFAEMAAEQVGAEGMIDTSEAVGFNDRPPIDLPDPAESLYPTDFGEVVSEPEGKAPVVEDSPALAQTGIGQNDVAATPLQMALVAAAVANGGEIMTPHVMSEVRARSGDVVDRFDEGVWRTAFNPNVAETLKEAMVGVVSDGTAAVMDIPGAEVGAKTGTAQLGTDPPRSHAWMIAFAGPPGEAPTVAVAVVVNDLDGGSGQTGGQVAGPIARAVVETALAVQ